jgi:Uma2 family endonuclease
MNARQPLYMDNPAFLDWVAGREGRYELAGGRVLMMTGGTRWHQLIVGNTYTLLRTKLDRKRWSVMTEFGLDIGPGIVRYPDIVVDYPSISGRDLVAKAPTLVVEVLSPSTEKTDFGDKAAEYARLPSLNAYLILAQDEVRAWLYRRNATQFLEPQEFEGRSTTLTLPSLDIVLSLADIYEDIEFGPKGT